MNAEELRARQEEVDRNYEVFKKLLPSILADHWGKFALMRDGKVVAYYTTAEDAQTTGEQMFSGKPFSIQQVTDSPIDLGFYSHALHLR